ncbi:MULTISPECIES: YisL family protein [Bacillaceae]|uniref:YisL family protein n=1 Tax=Bacillaceae TaxID=186817 RepID=UPI001E653978|nr:MULTISPECIES: YisL family protein [Bacillaceae]MCE4050411.1 YisL family protein [Bacillus sp. Au-Bac7]MCM3030431.1 YisL family protein [Niallia sp. MER 6]MDL0434645.1 YisL family protein [Niallia sp. SS-2023]UPO88393.1 YisL family protein [Niallia sp. Man26]
MFGQIHFISWMLTLVLFVAVLFLRKTDQKRTRKIVHMIARLLYIFIIVSGAIMLFRVETFTALYMLKALVGFWVISMMEMILVRLEQERKVRILWGQFAVALVLVLYIGYAAL